MASENVWEAGPRPEFPDVTPQPERPEPDPSRPLYDVGLAVLVFVALVVVLGTLTLVLR